MLQILTRGFIILFADQDIEALRAQAVAHTDNIACILGHIKKLVGPEQAAALQKSLDLRDDFEDLDQTFPALVCPYKSRDGSLPPFVQVRSPGVR